MEFDDDFRLHFHRFGFGTLYCQSREVANHVCDVDVYFSFFFAARMKQHVLYNLVSSFAVLDYPLSRFSLDFDKVIDFFPIDIAAIA